MSIRTYRRKAFEVTLVAGASNPIYLAVDYLDENGDVVEPLDGSEYSAFFAQATPVPSKDNPEPEPLLKFSVTLLQGFIPEGDIEIHPGAFLLVCDPTESRVLQKEWITHGLLDLFGIREDNGILDYISRGNFTTVMTATRDFT